MPLISVVIATYNNADCLDTCLRSLSRQTFRDFETVVVNDGSTDHISEVVKKHNVRFVSYSENRGLAYARNQGIRSALGRYTAFIDSDAAASPEWLFEISKRLEPKTVLTGGSKSADGRKTNRGPRRRHYFGGSFPLPRRLSRWANAVYGTNMVFPRTYFDEHGYFSEFIRNYFDESDIISRSKVYRVLYLKRAVVFHDGAKNAGNALFLLARNNFISKISAYRDRKPGLCLFIFLFFMFRCLHASLLLARLRFDDAGFLFRGLRDGWRYCRQKGYF